MTCLVFPPKTISGRRHTIFVTVYALEIDGGRVRRKGGTTVKQLGPETIIGVKQCFGSCLCSKVWLYLVEWFCGLDFAPVLI